MVFGWLGYWVLKLLWPGKPGDGVEAAPEGVDRKLRRYFGDDFFERIRGKTVIDFGCGSGFESVEMARHGARVIGVDIQTRLLAQGEAHARRMGVSDRCTFVTRTDEKADLIISKDAFEHFADPAQILGIMAGMLKPEGQVLAAFGPTWLHPKGGHLFSVFPWAHLVFSESTLLRWRSDFKNDGATRFAEVDGGLNQLTIAEFERIVSAGPLRVEHLDTVPIRGIALLKHRSLREFGSSLVVCRLSLRNAPSARSAVAPSAAPQALGEPA